MTTFFTSDLHLGHARIIELCNRPFETVDEMNAAILERWNQVVQPEDTVYILGDLAMGPLNESLAVVAQLQGKKILVPGNHDRVWSGYYKNGVKQSDVDRYSDAGLMIAHQQVRYTGFWGTWAHPPASWTLCHFPDAGDSVEGPDRYQDHRPPAPMPGSLLVHGHVHTAWKYQGARINVGVDVWDFYPVPEIAIYSHWKWAVADPQWFM